MQGQVQLVVTVPSGSTRVTKALRLAASHRGQRSPLLRRGALFRVDAGAGDAAAWQRADAGKRDRLGKARVRGEVDGLEVARRGVGLLQQRGPLVPSPVYVRPLDEHLGKARSDMPPAYSARAVMGGRCERTSGRGAARAQAGRVSPPPPAGGVPGGDGAAVSEAVSMRASTSSSSSSRSGAAAM